jgi:hypothetical protein
MSLHLNLQCQRADKNTDTRITLSSEKAWSIWFFATVAVAGKPLRCGSTYLREPPRDVNRVFSKILDREPVGLISLKTPLIAGENATGRPQRELAMSTPQADVQTGFTASQNQPFIHVPVSRLSSLLRRFHRGRGWVPAHLDLDMADHLWLQQSLIIGYVEANYARAYKASRNRCCSLLECAFSMTKIRSAHLTSSAVSKFSASWLVPAELTSSSSCNEITC